MVWRQCRPGVWVNPLMPSWCLAWNQWEGFQLLNQPDPVPFVSESLSVHRRQRSDGWIDFFLGEAAIEDPMHRCSFMDAHQKVGLHYLRQDLDRLQQMSCPPGIPQSLWQRLQLKARQKD
jgi:hypothetical protein